MVRSEQSYQLRKVLCSLAIDTYAARVPTHETQNIDFSTVEYMLKSSELHLTLSRASTVIPRDLRLESKQDINWKERGMFWDLCENGSMP
jgi:hypothetical protein